MTYARNKGSLGGGGLHNKVGPCPLVQELTTQLGAVISLGYLVTTTP